MSQGHRVSYREKYSTEKNIVKNMGFVSHCFCEDILKEVKKKRMTIVELRKKQSRFFGHILWKGKLENIITRGKIKVEQNRERQSR
jgi:hypothetical protein